MNSILKLSFSFLGRKYPFWINFVQNFKNDCNEALASRLTRTCGIDDGNILVFLFIKVVIRFSLSSSYLIIASARFVKLCKIPRRNNLNVICTPWEPKCELNK